MCVLIIFNQVKYKISLNLDVTRMFFLSSEEKNMAKIAIIDDDPDIVEAIGTLLELKGFEVVSASDIEAGFDLISNEKPDIIILDVMMQEPDDGFYLAMKLRKKGFSTPIIMLTSIAKATGLYFGSEGAVPVNEFMEKPIHSGDLLDLINKYLSN